MVAKKAFTVSSTIGTIRSSDILKMLEMIGGREAEMTIAVIVAIRRINPAATTFSI
jgi:hypothetical protein